jgi:hypothetical protein
MAKHIEVSITISDRSETPMPNGNHEVYNTLVFRGAGVGPTSLQAFQAALEKGGGAEFLAANVGIPRLALAQVGMVGKQPS